MSALVLVPVDFSASSRKALGRALELAKAFERDVALLHVVDTTTLPASLADEVTAAARTRLEALADEHDRERRHVKIVDVREGRPWRVILAVAASTGPALIVVGKRADEPHEMGSVSERVVRGAPCDVLVVHGE